MGNDAPPELPRATHFSSIQHGSMPSPPQEVVGVWRLLSYNLFRKALNGQPHGPSVDQPLGATPVGRLAISSNGYLSAVLTMSEIPPIKEAEWINASEEEIVRVARWMTTYCGFCTFSEGKDGLQQIATQVDVALNPNWIGGVQVRRWRMLNGNSGRGFTRLELQPVQELLLPDGTLGVGVLVWEKISD